MAEDVKTLSAQLAQDPQSLVFLRLGELYITRAGGIADLWAAPPHTLAHGDPHMGNLFVDGPNGNRTGFLDWAMIGRSPGLRDVAYVLCNSIPAAVRAGDERGWVDLYCSLLAESGVDLGPGTLSGEPKDGISGAMIGLPARVAP